MFLYLEAPCKFAIFFGHESGSLDFPFGSAGKESCSAGDLGLISGLGRSPGEGNGNPVQYSCLRNPMDRGGTLDGVTKESGTT